MDNQNHQKTSTSNLLQISAPKSGSYWLHTILLEILKRTGSEIKSFIQEQEVYQKAKNLELSFAGQAGVDMMDIEEEGCFYRISSIFREPIEDLEVYAGATSLAWTHSTLCHRSFEVLPLFNKKVCIVRDPRDRALSVAKFAFTPYMQKYYTTSYTSPEEYLKHEFERLLDQWVWFVGNYMLHKEELNIHFVFYENLLHEFPAALNSLLKYLEIPLSQNQQHEIADAVTFSSMKNTSPKHLHKGRSGKWVDQLSESQKNLAIERAGTLMQWLNYPLHPTEEDKLPELPADLPKEDLLGITSVLSGWELYR